MQKEVIHIGFYKTGSTFLQNKVFSKLEDTFYVGGYNLMYNYNFNKLLYQDDYYYDTSLFRKEFSNVKNKKLISSEWIIGDQKFYGINRTTVAKRLQKSFPEAEIVLFIRSQKELMRSMYNQTVKVKRTHHRLNDFYSQQPEFKESITICELESGDTEGKNKMHFIQPMEQCVIPSFFNFYDIIKMYKELFGKVHVFLYEDLLNDQEGTIKKLLKVLGEEKCFEMINLMNGTGVNKSIGDKELEQQRIFNKLSLVSGNKLYRRLAKLVARFTAKDVSASNNDFLDKYFKQYYIESNRKLIEEFPEIGIQNYSKDYLLT